MHHHAFRLFEFLGQTDVHALSLALIYMAYNQTACVSLHVHIMYA